MTDNPKRQSVVSSIIPNDEQRSLRFALATFALIFKYICVLVHVVMATLWRCWVAFPLLLVLLLVVDIADGGVLFVTAIV